MKRSGRAGTLFLLEIIFTILFFSLAAAVCVNIFAKAREISGDAQKLNHAVTEVSNICETVAAAGSREEAETLLAQVHDFHEGCAALDENYEDTEAQNAVYLLSYRLTETDGMLTADVSMKENGTEDELFSQQTTQYIGRQN